MKYPYSRPQIDADDRAGIEAALACGYLNQGPELDAFEPEFGAPLGGLGGPEASVYANGPAVLHLAYLAADLRPERGLLTAPITFLATANAARMAGAPVVLADVDPVTGYLDPESVHAVLRATPVPVATIAAVYLGSLSRRRGAVMDALAARGVGAEVHYAPLHHQPYYRDIEAPPLSGAGRYYARTLSIPMYPGLGDDDLVTIADAARGVVRV